MLVDRPIALLAHHNVAVFVNRFKGSASLGAGALIAVAGLGISIDGLAP